MDANRHRSKKKIIERISCLILTAVFFVGSGNFCYGQTAGKTTENFGNLVVFVQYDTLDAGNPSTNFMNTTEYEYDGAPSYTDLAVKYWVDNSYSKSLNAYLKAASFNQFNAISVLPQYTPGSPSAGTADTIIPIVLPAGSTDDTSLIAGICAGSNAGVFSGVDTSKIDCNNDGYIDNLTIIVQGSNPTGIREDLYPHKANYGGTDKAIAGKTIDTYNVINSQAAFEGQKEGVVCHEFMHSIGFPDLYVYSGDEAPVGSWDIMSGTSSFLQYPLVYMRKAVKGWVNIDEITSSRQNLTLVPSSQASGSQAYVLKSPLSDGEFFVVECRHKGKQYSNEIDVKVGDCGDTNLDAKFKGASLSSSSEDGDNALIVYRVNSRVERISNASGENAVVILGANPNIMAGATKMQKTNSAYFSEKAGRTSFGSTDLNVTENTLAYSDGTNSGIKISNIKESVLNNNMTFDVEFADTSNVELWKTLGGGNVSSEAASGIDMAQDSNNTPYVLYETDSGLFVKKRNGDSWATVGGTGTIASNAFNASLKIYNDIPYVFYSDGTSFNLKVKKLTDDTWVSGPVINGTFTQHYDATVSDDGIYILCSGGDSSPYAYSVKKYDGSVVTSVATNVESGDLYWPSISKYGDKLYVAFMDNSSFDKIIIDQITNGSATRISNGMSGKPCKLLATQNGLYAAVDTNGGLEINKYVDGLWTQVGDKLTATPSVCFDIAQSKGTVYVGAVNQATSKTCVYYEKNNSWVQKGLDVDNRAPDNIALAVDDGIIYVAYLNSVGDDSFPVVKYNYTPDNSGQEPVNVTVNPVTGGRFVTCSSSSVSIAWTKQTGVTGYEIWRRVSGGSYQKVTTVLGSTSAYTNSKLSSGKTYYYKLRAYSTVGSVNYYSAFSSEFSTTTKPAKVSIRTPKTGKRKVTVKWHKTSGATYYQIYRATKKYGKYKRVKTVSYKYSYWTNKKLKRGKTYYYKVRAVKSFKGKYYYGSYSSKKRARAK